MQKLLSEFILLISSFPVIFQIDKICDFVFIQKLNRDKLAYEVLFYNIIK